jgi:hypothetical protein
VLEDLGFKPAYRVELDPVERWEGGWDHPTFASGREGKLTYDFASTLRTTILTVKPQEESLWIGMFESGHRGYDGTSRSCATSYRCEEYSLGGGWCVRGPRCRWLWIEPLAGSAAEQGRYSADRCRCRQRDGQ